MTVCPSCGDTSLVSAPRAVFCPACWQTFPHRESPTLSSPGAGPLSKLSRPGLLGEVKVQDGATTTPPPSTTDLIVSSSETLRQSIRRWFMAWRRGGGSFVGASGNAAVLTQRVDVPDASTSPVRIG